MEVAAQGSTPPCAEPEKAELEVKQVPYAQQKRLPPWEMKDIRWAMGGYITVVHVLAIVGLFKMANCTATTLW